MKERPTTLEDTIKADLTALDEYQKTEIKRRFEYVRGFLQKSPVFESLLSEPDLHRNLAQIIGCDNQEISILSWKASENNLALGYMEQQSYCPICLSSYGYFKRSWELSIVTSCPEHGVDLVRTCACGRAISVRRENYFKCECSLDLREQHPIKSNCSVSLELADLVSAKVNGIKVTSNDKSPLFYLEINELSEVILTFIKILHERENYRCNTPAANLEIPQWIRGSMNLFEEWPLRFWAFLDRICGKDVQIHWKPLERLIDDYFGSLWFKLDFLRAELISNVEANFTFA